MPLEVVKVVDVLRWRVHVEPAATEAVYSARQGGFAESCEARGCVSCRNYVRARSRLPNEFVALLEDLGVDPSKEDRCGHRSFIREGLISYHGIFGLVGEIVSGADCHTPLPGPTPGWRTAYQTFLPDLQVGFTAVRLGARNDGVNLWLEFHAELPWLIEGNGFAAAVLVHGRDMPPPGGRL